MKPNALIPINPWRELSVLMLVVMEACWVTPWFRSLTVETSAVDPIRVFFILSGMVLFAHISIRLMEYLQIRKSWQRGIFVTLIVLAILIGIKTMLYVHQSMSLASLFNKPLRNYQDFKSFFPPEFIVVIAVILAFWRGLSIAQEYIGPSSVATHFWLGIIMYVAYIFLNTFLTGETPGGFLFIFIFSSLLAMCFARLTVVGMLRGGNENKFNRYWLVGIILVSLITVFLSAALSGVIGEQFIHFLTIIMGLLTIILGLVWILFNPIISTLLTFLSNFFSKSFNSSSLGDGLQNLNKLLQQISQKMSNVIGDSGFFAFFERWGPTIKTILLIIMAIIVLFFVILWMAISLWHDRSREPSGNEQRANLQIDNIYLQLMDYLRKKWRQATTALDQITDLNYRQKMRAAARIRRVYAELMELCTSLGHSRPDAVTPLEFLPELKLLFPELQTDASAITEAYNYVRYGELPETHQDVATVDAAWKRLSTAGHRLATALKHTKK